MRIEELKYSLALTNLEGTPRELRLGRRDLGRLLLVDRSQKKITHSRVSRVATLLSEGDVLVLNNSKRIPGVLRGFTESYGQVELRFVDLNEDGSGLCRVFPMHDVRAGTHIQLRGGGSVQVQEMGLTKYELSLVRSLGTEDIRALLKAQGIPILGFFYNGIWGVENLNPYYASEEGSVESPLAGLHFTSELVAEVKAAGVDVRFVTLHSVGSWLPFLEDNVEEHEMWAERYYIPQDTAEAVSKARRTGKRVVACGSTSLRALESAADENGQLRATSGRTSLYITPSYRFKAVTSYFTNFHQYQTSLIVLDAAFGGPALVKRAYREATQRGYAFYEFGDAVLYI